MASTLAGGAAGALQRAQVIQPAWEDERVYGHKAIGLHSEEESGVVERIRVAVGQAQEQRRQLKRQIIGNVYRERAKFGAELDRDEIKSEPGGPEFLGGLFGQGGTYVRDLEAANVTSRKIRDQLGAVDGLELQDDADRQETRVHLNGKHVYTFYRGATAFEPAGPTSAGRTKFTKHGSVKKYVADDRGTPTRRYAYGVKDSTQVGIVRGGGLRGRYAAKNPDLRALKSKEYPLVGLKRKGAAKSLTDDQLLFLHQEHGSSDSQRGVSLASTEYPLLSNAARGFASANDAGTRKLRIDLGKVPVAAPGEVPNLVNYYQNIPGFRERRVKAQKRTLRHGARVENISKKKSQEHFDWSTGKNRELFLRELLPAYVKGQKGPSPLEDQTYNPNDIDDLLLAAKGQAYGLF